MLRISIIDDSRSTTLRAEGKLAHEWVDEARRVWHVLKEGNGSNQHQRELVMDLVGVTFVDDLGRQLLADMRDSGVRFVSAGPMITGLLEELSPGDCVPRRNRFKKALLSVLFLILVFVSGRMFAEGPGMPILTLADAVELAKAHNRELKIQQIQAAISNAEVAIAKTKRLPSLSTDVYASGLLAPISFEFDRGAFGTYEDIGPIPDTKTKVTAERSFNIFAMMQVRQPLSQLYRINLGIRAKEAEQKMAEQVARRTEQEVVRQVRSAYYAVLQTRSAFKASEASVASLSELRRVLFDRVQQRSALPADEFDVRAALARAQQDKFVLENTYATQKEQMNLLLGRDPDTEFVVESNLIFEPAEEDLVIAQQTALARRPELQEAALRVEAADYDRRIKKAERLPDVGVFMSYFSPFNVDVVPKNIAAAGIQVSWEPFDWGRRSKELEQKKLALEQAKAASQQSRDGVKLEVKRAYRSLREASSMAEVARLGSEAAQERLRVVTNQFDSKAALLKDVLESQSKVAEAEHTQQEALLAYWNAKAEFAKAIGED
jgi:outer membrane protein